MTGFTSPYLWYTSRATGVVALIMLTLVIVFGILISTRVGGRRVGRFEINELHRSFSLIALLFVGVHVVATVIDTYVPIHLLSAVVPFSSFYKRLPVALGTVAFDLMLVVWVSSQLKDRIATSTWRTLHWASYASFVAAVVHAFVVGTDAHARWMLFTSLACVAVVVLATGWRVVARPERAAGRTALSPLQPRSNPSSANRRPSGRGGVR